MKDYTEGPVVYWRDTTEWDAVYAVPKGKTLIKTRPLVAWALVGVIHPGEKSFTTEISGVLARIGQRFLLCGQEERFLGYRRTDVDAHDLFWKEALAYRKRKSMEKRKRKS